MLRHKKAAVAPNATPQQKQVYADSLARVRAEASHAQPRARGLQRIQLEFADELAALGRYQDCDALLSRGAAARSRATPTRSADWPTRSTHLAVSRDKLLRAGEGDVAAPGGAHPRQADSRLDGAQERRDSTVEAWYYRKIDGGVAGVYFRDGELFAAEENSSAKIAALN